MKVEAGFGVIAGRDVTDDAEDLALFVYRYPPVRASMEIEPPYDSALESAEGRKRGAREVFVGGKTRNCAKGFLTRIEDQNESALRGFMGDQL
jgi:hypothetical protein